MLETHWTLLLQAGDKHVSTSRSPLKHLAHVLLACV